MTNTEFVTQGSFGHRFIFSGLYIRAVRHRPGLEMYIYTQPLFLGYAAPVFHLEAQIFLILLLTDIIPDGDSLLSLGCKVLVLLACRDLKPRAFLRLVSMRTKPAAA